MATPTPTPASGASLAGTTLNNIQAFTSSVLGSAEEVFKTFTNALSTGGTLSMASMIQYQAETSKFTLTAQIMSAITKEMIDTMKSIANKIG
jgi:hypothetical protein